jgi:hypothetical protein
MVYGLHLLSRKSSFVPNRLIAVTQVWLDPELLPTTTQLECASCHHPMTFLLQVCDRCLAKCVIMLCRCCTALKALVRGLSRVSAPQLYSPIETRDDCFHRTIYVFFCNESNCSGSMSSRYVHFFVFVLFSTPHVTRNSVSTDPVPHLALACFVIAGSRLCAARCRAGTATTASTLPPRTLPWTIRHPRPAGNVCVHAA